MTMKSDSGKQIRFIDSNYNTLFTIPDGGTIYLQYSSGEQFERQCKALDECHMEISGQCWHICQFAERMEENGTKYAPMQLPANMPYRSYSVNQSSGELVLLKYGETGYFHCNHSTNNTDENILRVEKLHHHLGISKAQAAAMQGGSLFGFDKPIANPENYDMEGNMRSNNPYDRSFAERMKRNYPVGTKIELDQMTDPYHSIPAGTKGIVDTVDDLGTLHCIWENGSTLGVVPGEDVFHKVVEPPCEPNFEPEPDNEPEM